MVNVALKFSQYVSTCQDAEAAEEMADSSLMGIDIEKDIQKEIQSMKSSNTDKKKPYSFVRLDISCGMCFVVSCPSI